jgi:hypothetical protein
MWTAFEAYKYEAIQRQKEAQRNREAAQQVAINKARRNRQS